MRKRFIGSIISLILMVSLFLVACSSKEETTGSSTSDSSGNGEASENIELEIISGGNNLPAPEDDVIKQELEKAIGAEVNLSVVSSEYDNQLNVRLAAGDFPDLFAVNRQQILDFSKKGLLLDLTPHMEKIQSVVDFIGEDNVTKAKVDDKVFAVTVPPQIPYNTYWIRKDWLDNLGIQAPTTVDELLAVASAFTQDDPDGNGKNDTYGITGGVLNAFQPIFGAYGVGMPGSFYLKDGELVNSFYDPAMKDALSTIKKFIESGVVDPEVVTNTALQHQQKAFQGQYGIIYIDWPNITKEVFVEQIKTVNPDAEWIQLRAPEGPAGYFDGTHDIGTAPRYYAIPKELEDDPAKLEKVFELLNYVSSDKGSKLVQYGVEGEHFNLEDGKVVPTDLLAEEGAYFWLYQFTGRPEMEYLKTKFAAQEEYIEYAAEQPRIEALNGFVDIPEGYNPADATRYYEEEIIKFIYGERPLSEYEDFVATLESTFNYQAMLDAAEQQLTDKGLVK